MNEANSPDQSLPDELSPACRERLRRFAAALQSGHRPSIQDYVQGIADAELPNLIRRLFRLDRIHRQSSDPPPDGVHRDRASETTQHVAPEGSGTPERPALQPNGHDFDSRPTRPFSDSTSIVPGHAVGCPHCHEPIALPDPGGQAVCGSCGSSFRVEVPADSAAAPTVFRRLGRFQLAEEVGRGAFGAVWRAWDTVLRRSVALKIPHSSVLSSGSDIKRFLHEARAAARLDHPGIVRLYEVPVIDGTPVLVSDFIDGLSLKDLLRLSRPSFRTAATLLADLAEATDYAHSRGLVHRDIKPGNVLVRFGAPAAGAAAGAPGRDEARSGWGKPVLVDFGLALRDEAEIVMTADGRLIGTPAYMSPEQARGQGHRVDRRSDVYSLGVVLYEMLCGELPFRGSKAMIVHQLLHEEPRAPRSLNDRIPRDLETICLKALAKEPHRRYASAGALADDLRRYLRHEPIHARPVGRAERLWRWCRRNPLVAALSGAVAVSVVLGLIFSLHFAARAETRARQAEAASNRADESARLAQQMERLKEQQWYVSQINLIGRDRLDRRVDRMMRRLEELDPSRTGGHDLRSFEWYYLQRQCGLDLQTFASHQGTILATAVSPSGRLVAAAGDAGKIQVLELATGKERYTLTGHHGPVDALAFHPDDSRLFSGGEDHALKVWDVETGRELPSLPPADQPITCLSISGDGSYLAAGCGLNAIRRVSHTGPPDANPPGHIARWDLRTGQRIAGSWMHPSPLRDIALSPDGQSLLSIDQVEEARLWDTRSGRVVQKLTDAHSGFGHLAFRPDGRRFAMAGKNQPIAIRNLATGEVERLLPALPGSWVTCLAFSLNGERLAIGTTDHQVMIWDPKTGRVLLTLTGHTDHVTSVHFTPDGRRLISSSRDGTIKVWDATREQEPLMLPAQGSAFSVAFAPDGQLACGRKNIEIWDPGILRKRTIPGDVGVHALAFSPDASVLASGDWHNRIRLWDPRTGQAMGELLGHTDRVTGLGFLSGGERLISASRDGTVRIWNLRMRRESGRFPEQLGHVCACAVSADGEWIVTGGADGIVRVGNVREARFLYTLGGHTGTVWGVAFHPSGALVGSASFDGTVRVWDFKTGQEKLRLPGHLAGAASVCFSPDGRRLVTSDWDGAIRLWDINMGQELLAAC